MPIDNCPHTFAELAATVLPRYMGTMREALRAPVPLSEFARPGIGPKGIQARLGIPGDFAGCFVLLDDGQPFFVGTSHAVLARLRKESDANQGLLSTLAYKFAKRSLERDSVESQKTRSAALKDPGFHGAFLKAQNTLRSAQVAFIPIVNPLEMHLFEAYCAMELDTAEWNTFSTRRPPLTRQAGRAQVL